MSYILDALKKSERERPPGTVPDLFTVHGPQSQPPSPRWPTRAIVAVALLLAVPAIGLLAWIGTGRRDESACRPPVAASPQPRADDPTAPATPRMVAAPTPLRPRRELWLRPAGLPANGRSRRRNPGSGHAFPSLHPLSRRRSRPLRPQLRPLPRRHPPLCLQVPLPWPRRSSYRRLPTCPANGGRHEAPTAPVASPRARRRRPPMGVCSTLWNFRRRSAPGSRSCSFRATSGPRSRHCVF